MIYLNNLNQSQAGERWESHEMDQTILNNDNRSN